MSSLGVGAGLTATAERILGHAAAFAVDVGGQHAGPSPSIDFARLVPGVTQVRGPARLVKLERGTTDAVLDRVASCPPLPFEELARDGASALSRRAEAVLGERGWPHHAAVSLLVARAIEWSCELWAVEELAGIRAPQTVTDGVIPVWNLRFRQTVGGAAGIGSAVTRHAVRASGRADAYASSLQAQGQCRIWITPEEWVLARATIAPTGQGLPLVFDRIPRARIVGVRKVWPRLTLTRQLEVGFDDGSRARFVYVTDENTLGVLASSVQDGSRAGDE